jgi:hypothetical protein
MGFFGYGPMDGDDAMDLRDEVFAKLGVKFDDDANMITTNDEVKELLESRQNLIYDWLKAYDWNQRSNPGFIQTIYSLALADIMCDYGARINKRGKKAFIQFIDTDAWSEQEPERALEMSKLKIRVLENLL